MIRKLTVDDRMSTISRNKRAAQSENGLDLVIDFNGVQFVKEGASDWVKMRKQELEKALVEEVTSSFIQRRFGLKPGDNFGDLLYAMPDYAQVNVKLKEGRNLFELKIDKEEENRFRLSAFNADYYIY